MKLWIRMFAFLFTCLCVSSSVWAQTATTALRGNITDHTGARVTHATISLTDTASGVRTATKSDGKGEYVFSPLAPGRYSITVSASGFAEQTAQAELLVNQPANINFSLDVHATSMDIDVSAEVQTLNVTDATLGNAVNNNTIQALPMEGRNVPDLLSVQPGVLYLGRGINQNSDSRSGAVSGARSDQSNVTLDGIDNNDQTNGYAFTGVLRTTLDATEEFRVTTASSNADAGRSSGAQVNLVTKSGTNQWHGSLYEYNRNTIRHSE